MLLFFRDGTELTGSHTGTALNALGVVDDMRLLDGTGNCANRALARTSRTALTLFRIDDVAQQALADAGGALLVNDVSNILVSEVLQGGQDRVGSRLEMSIRDRSTTKSSPTIRSKGGRSLCLDPTFSFAAERAVHPPIRPRSSRNSRRKSLSLIHI